MVSKWGLAQVGHPWQSLNSLPLNAPGGDIEIDELVWLSPVVLRPPYLRGPAWTPAIYGGLGWTIGHELGHHLPAELRFVTVTGQSISKQLLDANDRSNPYVCLADHFTRMTEAWNVWFDAGRSSDEYTADLAGLDLVLEALRADPASAGLGAEAYWQRIREFFVSFAQYGCSMENDFRSRLQTVRDPHPSIRLRVNGVVSEMPEFARAFACGAGEPMAPADRCVAW